MASARVGDKHQERIRYYKDGEIEEVVNSTTAAILNFALLLTASPDRTKQAREIEDLMIAFAEDKL